MPVVDRIAGPGITANDVQIELPDAWDHEEFRKRADLIVHKCKQHCADTLRGMLANTPNASKLADEFAARLGL